MNQFTDQITEIAAFAKAKGFNPVTQFDELMREWNKMAFNRAKWIEDNKDTVIVLVKQL